MRFKLIPKTMTGKALLKRLFLGALVLMPAELAAGMADYQPPVPLAGERTTDFKIVYSEGRTAMTGPDAP